MRAFVGLCVLACLLAVSGCATSASREAKATARLAVAMAERLEIARDVAWAKANSGAPVLDPKREAALIDALVKQGMAAGIAPARVERFFTAQIAASRQVQTELLDAWRAGEAARPGTPPRDLAKEIRPQLDTLSTAMIKALAECHHTVPEQRRKWMAGVLKEHGFSDAVITRAMEGI